MKSIILILLTLTILTASSEPATKDDIKSLIHQMDKRFDAMQNSMDKRFEQVDKRFEQVDKRFEDMMSFMFLLATGTFGLIGFSLWDRRTMINTAKRELEPELIKKADKNMLDKVISIIEEMAKNDKIMQEILKKHNFKIVKS